MHNIYLHNGNKCLSNIHIQYMHLLPSVQLIVTCYSLNCAESRLVNITFNSIIFSPSIVT